MHGVFSISNLGNCYNADDIDLHSAENLLFNQFLMAEVTRFISYQQRFNGVNVIIEDGCGDLLTTFESDSHNYKNFSDDDQEFVKSNSVHLSPGGAIYPVQYVDLMKDLQSAENSLARLVDSGSYKKEDIDREVYYINNARNNLRIYRDGIMRDRDYAINTSD
jgi:ABC-type sulfate transport system substrate-binding protein